MEPERSEVINGPNLGGFLGLAPDLRRLGRQGLAWPSGTQGLLLDQAFGISQRAALAATQPATALRRLARVRTLLIKTLSLSAAWTSRSSAEKFFLLGFSERVCVCSCALLPLLGFWHHASSIQLKPSLTG